MVISTMDDVDLPSVKFSTYTLSTPVVTENTVSVYRPEVVSVLPRHTKESQAAIVVSLSTTSFSIISNKKLRPSARVSKTEPTSSNKQMIPYSLFMKIMFSLYNIASMRTTIPQPVTASAKHL